MAGWLTKHFPNDYWDKAFIKAADGGAEIIRVLVLYLILRWVVIRLVKRATVPITTLEIDPVRVRRVKTLSALVENGLLYTLAIVSIVMVLRAVGVDPVPLVTAAGVAGLAIGFGAQKLVRDVISGFFILLENQFAVGETVTIGAVTGTVCEVGLRTTRLHDPQGKLYIFSNGDIASVCNHSRGELLVPFEVNVSSETDLKRACDVLDGVGAEVSRRCRLSKPFQSCGVAAFDATKVTLKIGGSVSTAQQEQVLKELREEILRRFREENITIV